MSKVQMKMMLLVVLGALAVSPAARADESDQKTVMTFSGPVEVPGQVLPAGTYVFKLAATSGYRHVVQVFNKRENHIFGTFLAIPYYQRERSDKTIVTFHERPAGSPDAIRAWVYPGRTYGHEFVYPKTKAVALAKANHVAVPAMPVELTPDTTAPSIVTNGPEWMALILAPLKAEIATGDEVELAEAFPDQDRAASAPSKQLPKNLPSTATQLPAVALIGLLSRGTAITLRLATSRVK
jgi:hypothetical protein